MMLWNNWDDGDYTMYAYINPTLADGEWHEVVMDIAGDAGPFAQSVDGFRFLVNDKTLGPDGGPDGGGPPSPATAQYLFDDIWIE